MEEGLYAVEFYTAHGTGNGIVYATNGKIRGGNSWMAFIGNYSGTNSDITVKVSTQRYNPDPSFKPLFGTDMVTLTLKGAAVGDIITFEGTALQLPGVRFNAVLTRVSD